MYHSEVKKLMRRIQKQCEEMGNSCELRTNDIRHQRKFSECGVYCIHFIVKMLEGADFDHITKNVIDDDTMNSIENAFSFNYFFIFNKFIMFYYNIYEF